MDDMILIHNDKEYLKYCKQEIEKCVNEKLNLQLNSKTQTGQLKSGIDFLGFRHILMPNGKILRFLRGQAKVKLKNDKSWHHSLNKHQLSENIASHCFRLTSDNINSNQNMALNKNYLYLVFTFIIFYAIITLTRKCFKRAINQKEDVWQQLI